MGGLARSAGWGGWRTGAWDNGGNGGWNGGWNDGLGWGLGFGLAGLAFGAAFVDPYAYWGPYWGWGWPAYAAYDPYDYGYWDYGYGDPWWDGYWQPSAYYGWGGDWWRRHHRYRPASYASYADDYGYGGPTYGYAGYWPAYDGYQSAAYASDYSGGPTLNPAYLSEASYASQLCVQRHYVWDDYYGNYVERLNYVPC